LPSSPIRHRLSAAGVVAIEGPDRESFLQGQLTQDVRGLAPGASRLAAGLTSKGKVLYFGRLLAEPERFLILLPRDAVEAVRTHLAKYAAFQKVTVRDASEGRLLAALYGPGSAAITAPPGDTRLPAWGELAGEILGSEAGRGALEAALAAAGSIPISDDVAEALRIEAGRPRLGFDATEANLPDEVGLEDALSRTKGCYVGQEIVARRKTYGKPTRRLAGLRFEGAPMPTGTALALPERPDRELARVTSVATSERFGPIGLGIVSYEAADGARLAAAEDSARLAAATDGATALVVPLPFA
jgi:folate-binding protein YgfZ